MKKSYITDKFNECNSLFELHLTHKILMKKQDDLYFLSVISINKLTELDLFTIDAYTLREEKIIGDKND